MDKSFYTMIVAPIVAVILAICGYVWYAKNIRPINAAQDSVKLSLVDPESAQFRNVIIVGDGFNKYVCGEVNSKNKFGGYVGFNKFYYSVETGNATVDSELKLSDIFCNK